GFLRDYNKTHLYGKGVYFARDARYPIYKGYAVFEGTTCCTELLYCRMVCGESTVGKETYIRPPPKSSSDPRSHEFESMIDSISDPTIFVATNDFQSYPVFKFVVQDKLRKANQFNSQVPVNSQSQQRLSGVVCPNNHSLTSFRAPHQYFICDVCKQNVATNDLLYGCRSCNWDMCVPCSRNRVPSNNHSSSNLRANNNYNQSYQKKKQ
ncbi:poly ADP-ribose polymerase, partial [Reticulomyxa filosa]